MTLEPDQLTRPRLDHASSEQTRSRRSWAVPAVAALGVAAAIGIGAAVAASSDPATDSPRSRAAPSASTAPVSGADTFPVTLDVQGWTCDEPVDEKFACFNGGAGVLVTVRPAGFRDAYLSDPDKQAPDQYVSDVHAGKFATVIRMPDDSSTDVFALGSVLTWRTQ